MGEDIFGYEVALYGLVKEAIRRGKKPESVVSDVGEAWEHVLSKDRDDVVNKFIVARGAMINEDRLPYAIGSDSKSQTIADCREVD